MGEYNDLYKRVKKDIKKRDLRLSLTHYTYAWLVNSEGKLHHEESYVCFGWTANTDKEDKHYLVHARCDCKLPVELQESFIRWVVEESPYRGTILNPVSEIISEGIAIGDGKNAPHNVMYAAMFCIRMVHERSVMIEMWGRLVERGLPKNVAFLLVNCFSYTEDGRNYVINDREIKLTGGYCSSSDHIPLRPDLMTRECLANYLRGDIQRLGDSLEDMEEEINSVNSMFSGSGSGFCTYTNQRVVYNFFKDLLVPEKVNSNPFLLASFTSIPLMSMDEAVEFCVNNWENFVEYING